MGTGENGGIGSAEVEVTAKARRRRFTADYKLKVLQKVDRCSHSGEIGALLRREGLYSSSLSVWRRQRERGELAGLAQKRRGPMPKEKNPLADKVKALERENARLRSRAERAEGLVALQKKVSEVLGIELRRERARRTDGEDPGGAGILWAQRHLPGSGGGVGELLPLAKFAAKPAAGRPPSAGVVG